MSAKKLTTSSKTSKEKEISSKKTEKDSAKPAVKTPTGKKKIVVSHKNLPPDILELLKEKYPKGYSDVLMKIDKGNGQFFYAVTLDTEDTDYLIKVDVKIDSEPEEIERALFGGGEQESGDEGEFPEGEENFDQADDEE